MTHLCSDCGARLHLLHHHLNRRPHLEHSSLLPGDNTGYHNSFRSEDAFLIPSLRSQVVLDAYFINQFITPLRLALMHTLSISLLHPRDLLYLLALGPIPWEAVVCIVGTETTTK